MSNHPPTATEARERRIWRRYARTSHVLNLVIVLLDTAYVLATWNSGMHRGALLGLNGFGAVGLIVAAVVVPEEKLASASWRNVIFAAWMLLGATLITLAAWADGGLDSPLAWLLPITVMFTALAHRPGMVALSGALAIAGYLFLAVVDGALASDPIASGLRAGYVIVLTSAAISGAGARWTHHDEQEEMQSRLARLADLDGLTGLLNHRAFHEALADRLDRRVDSGEIATVLLIDLDHFKGINDRYGHGAGDDVLRLVAQAITESARASDIAGRVGGEEFAVYLGATPPAVAHEIAERLRRRVAEIIDPEPVTASIGVGTWRGGAISATELLSRADEALYTAKRQGRNRTCWLRVA